MQVYMYIYIYIQLPSLKLTAKAPKNGMVGTLILLSYWGQTAYFQGLCHVSFRVRVVHHPPGGIRPCDQVVPVWLPWLIALSACTCTLDCSKPNGFDEGFVVGKN